MGVYRQASLRSGTSAIHFPVLSPAPPAWPFHIQQQSRELQCDGETRFTVSIVLYRIASESCDRPDAEMCAILYRCDGQDVRVCCAAICRSSANVKSSKGYTNLPFGACWLLLMDHVARQGSRNRQQDDAEVQDMERSLHRVITKIRRDSGEYKSATVLQLLLLAVMH